MARKRCVAIALELYQPFEWHCKVYAGALRYAQEIGRWRCVVDEFPEDRLPRRRTRAMAYDGIIARATKATAEAAARLGIPLVNTWFNTPDRGLPGVYSDYEAAGRMCAEHLLGRGFRRFGSIIQLFDKTQIIALRAFTGRLAEEGYPCHQSAIPRVWTSTGQAAKWSEMRGAINAWLDALTPPVGVYVIAPYIARQVEHLCHDRGWRVPQDVAILCGLNEDTACLNPEPGLSAVEHHWEKVGYEAARMLDRLMKGKPPPSQPILLASASIIQRTSTDFFAVEDKLVAEALRFIAANLHKAIDVHDVVKAMQTSSSTLERGFRKHVGRPMSAEITRLRLEKVKRQLAESKQSLKLIAGEAGLGDSTNLCRVFRRELGITPGEYRKQMLGNRQ